MISPPDTRAPSPSETAAHDPAQPGPTDRERPNGTDRAPQDDELVDLGRLAWFATVLVCLITVLVLVLQGYLGYAAVTFAVAVAAAINLF